MEKVINDYPIYKVTSEGNVINVNTKKILKPIQRKDGYMQVNLSIKGKRKSVMIHQLVAEAFLNKPKDYGNGYAVINHKDGNKGNNNVANLEYITQKENVNEGYRIGVNKMIGYTHPESLKLSKETVNDILNLYEKDYYYSEIAERYNISADSVKRVINNPHKYDKK